MDVIKLQASIRSFTLDDGPLGNQGYSRVLLQLFGYTGHGKSSFINSCKYVLDDGEDFIAYAKAADSNEAMTVERKAYDLTKNITIVDNRGCSTMSSFQRAEIYAQLGNFLPIGEKVEWMKDYTDMMTRLEDAERKPKYSDFIVPILIYSAATKLADYDREAVKEFMTNCVEMTGVAPIVVIIKKKGENVMEIEKMFKLKRDENIIFVENYTKKDHIKTREKTKDILMVIHCSLRSVKRWLRQERNPQKDWRERKKFMLDYIHKAEIKEKENEIRRAEEKRKREEENRRREEENRRREEENRRREEENRRREEENRRREEENRRREEENRRREEENRRKKESDCLIL